MNNKKLKIAYCKDNEDVAKFIARDLQYASYSFDHLVIGRGDKNSSFYDMTLDNDLKILVLVSDNFLKCSKCMTKGLLWLQKLANNNQIIPIIVDGKYPKENSSDFVYVNTQFDRVSSVIKYMNFWQDQYLDLRKLRRQANAKEEVEINEKINIVKGISSEIGEFLRYLKSIPHFTHQAFTLNNYEAFFKHIGDFGSHKPAEEEVEELAGENSSNNGKATEHAEDLSAKQYTNDGSTKSLVDIIEASSKEILEENEDINESLIAPEPLVEEEIEEEEQDIDLSEIPGMELLINKASNGSETSNVQEELAVETTNDEESTIIEDLNQNLDIEQIVEEVISEETMANVEEEVDLSDDLKDINSVVEAISTSTPEIEEISNEIEDVTEAEFENSIEEEDREALEDLFEVGDEDDLEEEEETEKDYEEEETTDNLDEIFDDKEEETEADLNDLTISEAYQKFESEEWQEGLKVLENALKSDPQNSDIRYHYALALARHERDFKGASRQLEILLGFDQQHENAYFLLGELAEMHGDFLTARNYFEKVAALNPDYPEVFYRLGLITLNHFDHQKKTAANYLKKAIKANKRNPDAHYRLGILMNEHFGKHWKAVKHFKKALKNQPEHPFANYDLAILYHRLGDRALANIYYQKATETNPELKTPKNDEAFKYELLGNSEESTLPIFGDPNEDPDFVELQRDLERLENKMAALNDKSEILVNTSEEGAEEPQETIAEEQHILEDIVGDSDSEVLEAVGELEESENIIDTVEELPTTEVLEDRKPLSMPQSKLVLITGATSGIGKATAEIFAQNGYRLILTGRRNDRLEALKSALEEEFDSSIKLLNFDVREVESVDNALDSLSEEWRDVDILINNAGLAKGFAPIHQGSLEHWETMIDTNIKGLLYMTRAISPHMVERKTGHIINVASIAGKEVYPNGNVYCATKFAVDALTKAMRIDLVQHKIRVSQVAPAHVEETEFALVRYDGDQERAKIYEDFQPLKSSDVAATIYFIATQPPHVNILDVVMSGQQQASTAVLDRSGRE